jgi:hypothetical protein
MDKESSIRTRFIDSEIRRIERDLHSYRKSNDESAAVRRIAAAPDYAYQRSRTKKIYLGASLCILVILLIATLSFIFAQTCSKDEFVSRVQNCASGTYLGQLGGSAVRFRTKNCMVTKEIARVSDDEPDEVRLLFEGKKMTCQYSEGQFGTDDIDYFLKGIENCWGDLKDILIELRGYQLRARV